MAAAIPSAAAEDRPALECAAIKSAGERLACYDAAYAKPQPLAQPQAADEVDEVLAPAAAANATGASQSAASTDADFGFAKPKQETEGESLTSGISSIDKDAYRRLIFELENGQVWRQIEYKRFDADAGEVAVIRHGSFGSYKFYVEGTKRWTRVRRIR